MKAPLPTFWWRWKHPHRLNFGDEITPELVERLTGRRAEWASLRRCELVGAGSVMQMLLRTRGENRPRVWGSGFISEATVDGEPVDLDVLAVRGRSTLARVTPPATGTIALGDPGLLAPILLDGTVRKRFSLGVVPHYRDAESPVVDRMRRLGPGVRVIDVAWTPQEVAREIAACDAVISSSLHGLIFSDALGVPNAHIPLGDGVRGGLYKFHDYYSAFPGESRYRDYREPTGGAESAGSIVDAVTAAYAEPTGLRTLQDGLVRAVSAL